MTPSDAKTRVDRVFDSWRARPCFICGSLMRCKHREYDVELALVDAELRRALRRERKPAEMAPAVRRQA